jgi:hypothetical protein
MKRYVLLAASMLAFTAQANADQVFFDGFESDAAGLSLTNLTNFTVTGGNTVDIVSAATAPGYGMSVTSNVVDLDGSPGPATLTSNSSFGFGAGNKVTLSFDVSGSQRGGVDDFLASIDFGSSTALSSWGADFGSGALVFDGLTTNGLSMLNTGVQSADPFKTWSLFFTAAQAGSLKFSFKTTSQDNIGPLLDNVALDVTAAVPEPATWAMMIGGFALVGASMRRRKTAVSFA